MKKNSQLHLWIETDLLDKLKKQAAENNILLAELCRQKLRDDTRINRLELIIERLEKLINLSHNDSRSKAVLPRTSFINIER